MPPTQIPNGYYANFKQTGNFQYNFRFGINQLLNKTNKDLYFLPFHSHIPIIWGLSDSPGGNYTLNKILRSKMKLKTQLPKNNCGNFWVEASDHWWLGKGNLWIVLLLISNSLKTGIISWFLVQRQFNLLLNVL